MLHFSAISKISIVFISSQVNNCISPAGPGHGSCAEPQALAKGRRTLVAGGPVRVGMHALEPVLQARAPTPPSDLGRHHLPACTPGLPGPAPRMRTQGGLHGAMLRCAAAASASNSNPHCGC